MGVKFGVEQSTEEQRGCGPQTVNFTKFWNINTQQEYIPCTILTKFSFFVGNSMVDPSF